MISSIKNKKAYLIGGGIASLSAAVYLIQDGEFSGKNITIFDESNKLGGSLDTQHLSSSDGYVMRGIRMFEEDAFACTFDLMSKIPSIENPAKNLREEFIDFNKENHTFSEARLIRNGKPYNSKPLGLKLKDKLKLFGICLRRESTLDNLEIKNYFSPAFFESNFWFEFRTAFAFQPWHSLIEFRRYVIRFIQDFSTIDTLETVEITPKNQYDSLILPVVKWLKVEGVNFEINTKIIDLEFKKESVSQIHYCKQKKESGKIAINPNDYVFVTLGSIVANSSIGSMEKAAPLEIKNKSAAWTLWENIAKDKPEFGKPKVFNSHIQESQWTSFTATFWDETFINLMDKFINKKVNAFGGFNIVDSNWFISIVTSYKPYFIGQPKDVSFCWGYALSPEKKGNFVKKKMSECTGEEILTELLHHLGLEKYLDKILKKAVCIPCTTPYITSHFLARKNGDRPPVIPEGTNNLAFIGQYCEIPKDVVFTVDYSVRSAQMAVYSLLGLKKKVTPIYIGFYHLKVLFSAIKTLFR